MGPSFPLCLNPLCHSQDVMSWCGLWETGANQCPHRRRWWGGATSTDPHLPPSRDEEIQSKCGIDATTYLSFQRHLLVLLMLVCVLSVAVILPVNFSGDLLGRCFPSHRMTQECHASFQAFGQALYLWERRQKKPFSQKLPCEQEPTMSWVTEEHKRLGNSGQWGLGGDLGDRKEGSKGQTQ